MIKIILSVLLSVSVGFAGGRAGGYVSGYTRANGTVVSGYYRGPSGNVSPFDAYLASPTPVERRTKAPAAHSFSSPYSPKPASATRVATGKSFSITRYGTAYLGASPTRLSIVPAKSRTEWLTLPSAAAIKRDANGRIARSSSVRQEFLNQTGYPHGRPGYIVDHIIALKRGGADAVSNLQWQTVEEAKAKDKTE